MKRWQIVAVLVAPGLLAARDAAAESYGGVLGLGYSNVSTRESGGNQLARNVLLLDADLMLGGAPLANGYLDYELAANYSSLRSFELQNTFTFANLGYSASLSAFRETAAPVSVWARRSVSDSTSTSQEFLGRGVTNTYGGSLLLTTPDAPQTSLEVSRVDSTVTNALGGRVERQQLLGTLRANQTLDHLRYDVLGQAERSTGSLEGAAYTNTFLSLSQESKVADDSRLVAHGALFRRDADLVGFESPDYWNESATLQLVTDHDPRTHSQVTYSYNHFRRADGGQDLDTGSQVLGGSLSWARSDWWSATGGLNLMRSTTQIDGRGAASWGESVVVGGSARQPLGSWTGQADASTTIGLVQPDTGTNGVSYGATVALSATTALSLDTTASAGINGGYASDTSAVGATSYDFGAVLNGTTRLLPEATGRLLAVATRRVRDSVLVGRSSSTLVSVQADGQWRSALLATLRYQHTVGASIFTRNPLETLPLPETDNVVTDTLSARLGWEILAGLGVDAGYSRSRISGLTAEQARDVFEARVRYQIGALTCSVQDSLATDRSGGLSRTSNLVYVLVSRSFGGVL